MSPLPASYFTYAADFDSYSLKFLFHSGSGAFDNIVGIDSVPFDVTPDRRIGTGPGARTGHLPPAC
ncbi:hypothetical protein [Geobacter sp. SVR]|uniref:hypothetical protein n=1 Tax=Geobacter sp. SVR TaxID=2495594 RepID=UPI0015657343|nr:hypothetical protein [Geobacter sp. SVR]